MEEINLLAQLPKIKRNISNRSSAKTAEIIAKSREFGFEYFDGSRDYGYGGYHYDGRWLPVARNIIQHFNLKPGDRVLDIGCAKGFLVKDLMQVCPGLEVFGVDISLYALQHCPEEVVGRLHLCNAVNLPFTDNSFDAVMAINVIHNLDRCDALRAIKEIQRVAPSKGFIQVDSFHTEAQRDAFELWALTAKFYDYPAGWMKLFREAGYTGDYFWTIVK